MTEESLVAPDYLSPSSIETFCQCPLKYKFSRIDKLVDPPTEATTLGSFVHATLEAFMALPANERTEAMARKVMADQWNMEWKAKTEEVLGVNSKLIHDFRWRAWWCIENYFKMEDPAAVELGGIERELDATIDGVRIRGFIDRWRMGSRGVIIEDYKTGKVPNPRYSSNKFFQLLIYGDIMATELNTDLEKVDLLYLKDGVRRTLTNPNEVQQSLHEMRVTVKATYEGIQERCEAGVFEPTRNTLCDWCSYKSFCPAWQN